MKSAVSEIRAFTLIELLAALAILAVLAGIGSAALFSAAEKGSMAAEMAAAKSLVAAYQTATTDNNGRFLPAYEPKPGTVLNAEGKAISMSEVRKRYPFRLAPYFNYAFRDTLLVGKNEQQFMSSMQLAGPSGPMYEYALSVFPALGINRHFVGGTSGAKDEANECIDTMADAERSVIVFISAGTEGVDGYEYVRAPGAPGGSWSGAPWDQKADPGNYGHVHPRHGGKAVAAFLDGSVKLLDLESLRDMRLWSRNAALLDDPGYKAKN
jgi:prepilin-type N-terminal cleavage/methylation domain-containing protein/prepilin-type processing-associated H-X9-DG protein